MPAAINAAGFVGGVIEDRTSARHAVGHDEHAAAAGHAAVIKYQRIAQFAGVDQHAAAAAVARGRHGVAVHRAIHRQGVGQTNVDAPAAVDRCVVMHIAIGHDAAAKIDAAAIPRAAIAIAQGKTRDQNAGISHVHAARGGLAVNHGVGRIQGAGIPTADGDGAGDQDIGRHVIRPGGHQHGIAGLRQAHAVADGLDGVGPVAQSRARVIARIDIHINRLRPQSRGRQHGQGGAYRA